MENFKTAVFYFSTTLLLLLIGAVNHFHEYLEGFYPYFQNDLILKISLLILAALGYVLYRREKRINQVKYEFLTIATHQFRTPITAIKWLVNSLKGEMLYEERMRVVKKLEVVSGRLGDIVDALSGMVKFDSSLQYAFEVAWPRDMIDVSIAKFGDQAHQKGIEFNVTSDPDIPLVIIDKRKIQSVIDILIENAISYSPSGSQIDIDLKKNGRFVILSFKDKGLGIKFGDKNKLFKRFWRSAEAKIAMPEGMGLSLSVAREIVRKHGGRIWAESGGLNKGSVFFVKLRVSDKRPKS
ncbi:MAG TPA: HAMP domain-containing sensor histidine kinase [Candidatus Paceibacterota bacterium]